MKRLRRFAAVLTAIFAAAALRGEGEAPVALAATEAQLRTLAQSGDAAAMTKLGNCYFRGERGVAKSPELAAYWFRQAAAADHLEGIFNLAVCLHHGLGVEVDLRAALRLYRRAGERGLAPARLMEAQIYLSGIPADALAGEIPPDPERARAVLTELAAQGYPAAERELGLLQLTGAANDEERCAAALLLERAAEHGDVSAARLTAELLLRGEGGIGRDEAKAVRFLRLAVAANDVEALAKLAFCLEYGMGTAADPVEALRCYRQAAEAGVPAAQLKLGDFYLSGELVGAVDVPRGLEYIRQAAASNHPAALFRLGICYSDGIGVAVDRRMAADYFLQAARRGEARAQYNLACLYLQGDGIPEDPGAAFYWFREAAEAGDVRAQRQTAFCYFEGIGIPANDREGLRWLKLAADQGDPEAIALLTGGAE